jgi:hypothetical protein
MNDHDDDNIAMIMEAFKDTRVTEVLSVVFNDVITKRTEKIEKDIDEIKQQNTSRDQEIKSMKRCIDKYEQNEREKNAIITGLETKDMTKEGVVKSLNGVLGCHLTSRDILYTVNITSKSKTEQIKPNKLRVAFSKKAKKGEVFKEKKKLKDTNCQIWITDDLTPMRTNLSYLARKAVRESKLKKTWVHDGKVFAVKKNEDTPYKITNEDDIPK